MRATEGEDQDTYKLVEWLQTERTEKGSCRLTESLFSSTESEASLSIIITYPFSHS